MTKNNHVSKIGSPATGKHQRYKFLLTCSFQDTISSTETINTIKGEILEAILEHIVQGFGSPRDFGKIWVPHSKLEKLVPPFVSKVSEKNFGAKFQIFGVLYRIY